MEREHTITFLLKEEAEEIAERRLTDKEYEDFLYYCHKGLDKVDLSGIYNCAGSEAGFWTE